jgi:hypothetical protein
VLLMLLTYKMAKVGKAPAEPQDAGKTPAGATTTSRFQANHQLASSHNQLSLLSGNS